MPATSFVSVMQKCGIYAIPIVYLAVILAIQPANRMIAPGASPDGYLLPGGYSRLISDDSDTLAWAMRAENASRGRQAGLVDENGKPTSPPLYLDQVEFEHQLQQAPKLTPRYFLEYPPAALYLFQAGHWLATQRPQQKHIPILLDANQYNVALHIPANDEEIHLIQEFRSCLQVYAVLMIIVLISMMITIQRGIGVHGGIAGPAWLLVLPAMLYFTPHRYDLLPSLLVLFAFSSTERGRPIRGAIWLALAISLKTYPVILAPLLLRYACHTWKQAFYWCLAVAATGLTLLVPMFITDGWQGIVVPIQFQMSRLPEPEYIFYGRFFPDGFAWGDWQSSIFRNGILILTVGIMCLSKPVDLYSLMRRSVVIIVVFVSLQVFYSPQWWQWFAPFLILLIHKHRWLIPMIIILDLWTYLTFPVFFDMHSFDRIPNPLGYQLRHVLVYGRGLLWFGLCFGLIREELREIPR